MTSQGLEQEIVFPELPHATKKRSFQENTANDSHKGFLKNIEK